MEKKEVSKSKITLKQGLNLALTTLYGILMVLAAIQMVPIIRDLASVGVTGVWSEPFQPVARFVLNMDWEKKTAKIDATMSKAYRNKIEKYIWRIDDGTGFIGDAQIEHKFHHAGRYTVQLSIVDNFGDSDSAECVLVIPPEEVEQIEIGQVKKADGSTEKLSTWVPKGSFFNYSKLGPEVTYSDIKSQYISSSCGLSNVGYNVSSFNSIAGSRNSLLGRGVISLIELVSGILVITGIYFVVRRFVTKIKD